MFFSKLMVAGSKIIQIIRCDIIDIYKMKILFTFIRLALPWTFAKLIEYKLLKRIEKAQRCINEASAYDISSNAKIKPNVMCSMQ